MEHLKFPHNTMDEVAAGLWVPETEARQQLPHCPLARKGIGRKIHWPKSYSSPQEPATGSGQLAGCPSN